MQNYNVLAKSVCPVEFPTARAQGWGPILHLFKQSTLKNDFKICLKKTFLSWPMRGLDMQYQVCNSISVVCSAGTSFKMDPVFKRSTLKNDLKKNKKTVFKLSYEGPRFAISSL